MFKCIDLIQFLRNLLRQFQWQTRGYFRKCRTQNHKDPPKPELGEQAASAMWIATKSGSDDLGIKCFYWWVLTVNMVSIYFRWLFSSIYKCSVRIFLNEVLSLYFEVLINNQCSIWYCAGTKRVFKHMRIIWVFVQPCILLLLIFTSAGRYCLVLLRIMLCFWNLN